MSHSGEFSREAIGERTRAECVRLSFRLSGATVAASLTISLVTAVWLWQPAIRLFLGAWVIGLLVLGLATLGVRRIVRDLEPGAGRIERWEQIFALICACHGLAWGALGFVELEGEAAPQHVALILMLGIVALVATGALVGSRLAFYSFVFAAIGPLATHLIADRPAPFPTAGWALLAYLSLLLALHELFHRNLLATIEKRFQSDALAREQQVIFDTAAEGIALLREGSLVKCNRRFAELVGHPAEELPGKPAWIWHPSHEQWLAVAEDCQPVIAAGDVYRRVMRLRRKGGELLWGEVSVKAVEPGSPERGAVWMARDMTEQFGTEAALRNSEARFRDLLSLSTDWYWEQDSELRFKRTSGGVLQRSGHSDASVIGKRRWEIEGVGGASPEQWQAHRELLAQRLPFRDFVYSIGLPGGRTRWVSVSGKPLFDEGGAFLGYHGVGSDITERVSSAEQLHHLAHHDMLTGLPNRRLLGDRLTHALALARRGGHRVAVMLLDLDDFKIVNDGHGHSIGDEVLVAVSRRLCGAVRGSDTVARLGGDEFVVLLAEMAHAQDAVHVAEKIISALREPVQAGGGQFLLGVSIGIALFPDHGETAERLLQHADIAMYSAKSSGGSAYQIGTTGLLSGEAALRYPEEPTRH